MSEELNLQYIELSEAPTPQQEQQDFSTAEEKRRDQEHNHSIERMKLEMEKTKLDQGPIGSLIGCSDTPLTIALVLLLLGFIGIFGAMAVSYWNSELSSTMWQSLITFELTVAGYLFGKKK